MEQNNIYVENGFKNREDYLNDLADSYGIDSEMVFALAEMLGDNEDFDGLLCACEDAQNLTF